MEIFSQFKQQKQSAMPLVLLFVAVAPAICVVWFMTMAVRNERLAAQQRLMDVYRNQLYSGQRQVAVFWKNKLLAAESIATLAPAEMFAGVVRAGLADSLVVQDTNGAVLYPSSLPPLAPNAPEDQSGWASARELEFQKADFSGAAAAYAEIAGKAPDVHSKVRALQSQANCLAKAGRKMEAIALLAEFTARPELADSMGAQGTLAIPNAQLLLLKFINDPQDGQFQTTLASLAKRLNDYGDAKLSASQRRFLMEEVRAMSRAADLFPTLSAEQLASAFLEQSKPEAETPSRQLVRAGGFYRAAAANGRAVLLFQPERLVSELESLTREAALPEVAIKVVQPGAQLHAGIVPPQEIGDLLPNWKLALQFQGVDPFEAASIRQIRIYLWTGSIVICLIGVLALLVARFVTAQMRLTQLKNDLVSTVSHELKTPLASMRALVETLIARRYRGPEQLEQYLRLIAKENHRLSHLIDNFLSFSRMEQDRQKFHFESTDPAVIVQDAVEALSERFRSDSCVLTVQLPETLPQIRGDKDALTTVLINLLDNAYKYTLEEKKIAVRAFPENGSVAFEVSDNGVGLNSREVRRVFDRFYQVDQSSTRRAGGCGLGLSIVQFIVKAHGGAIQVTSEPDQGSTFRFKVPLAETSGRSEPQAPNSE